MLKALSVYLAIVNLADAVTTYMALKKPNTYEGNPLMADFIKKYGWNNYFALKLISSGFFVIAGSYMAKIAKNKPIKDLAVMGLLAPAGLLSLAVINNIIILRREI